MSKQSEALVQRIRKAQRLWLGLMQIENKHLVIALHEPGRGTIQAPLRADVPVTSEIVAIDPDKSFAEFADVEISVGDRGESE